MTYLLYVLHLRVSYIFWGTHIVTDSRAKQNGMTINH